MIALKKYNLFWIIILFNIIRVATTFEAKKYSTLCELENQSCGLDILKFCCGDLVCNDSKICVLSEKKRKYRECRELDHPNSPCKVAPARSENRKVCCSLVECPVEYCDPDVQV